MIYRKVARHLCLILLFFANIGIAILPSISSRERGGKERRSDPENRLSRSPAASADGRTRALLAWLAAMLPCALPGCLAGGLPSLCLNRRFFHARSFKDGGSEARPSSAAASGWLHTLCNCGGDVAAGMKGLLQRRFE